MFNNVALDVFIGLVFIYLLYSLLATVLQEIIATNIGLRGVVLRRAIRKMLDDDGSAVIKKHSEELKQLICWTEDEKRELLKNIDELVKNLNAQDCQNSREKALSLYAAELKKAICSDDPEKVKEIENQIDALIKAIEKQTCYKSSKLSESFYKHPLIKYLANGSWPLSKIPSYIDKTSFSKVVVDLLRGKNVQPGDSSRQSIQQSLDTGQIAWNPKVSIEKETLQYLKSVWADSQGDVDKFKALLEQWFDEMMERTTGWYKKYTQIILMGIGLGVAIAFNVDTISIYKILSKDKEARQQLVQMAIKDTSRIRKEMAVIDKQNAVTKKQDSAFNNTYQSLSSDAQSANSTLGLGRPWIDSCKMCDMLVLGKIDTANVVIDKLNSQLKVYNDSIKRFQASKNSVKVDSFNKKVNLNNGVITFESAALSRYISEVKLKPIFTRCKYLRRERSFFKDSTRQIGGFWTTTIGWFLTALAISLGAPFWFDLLNKLLQLRSSITPKDDKTDKNAKAADSNSKTVKRVG